jgi:hypothetical protein
VLERTLATLTAVTKRILRHGDARHRPSGPDAAAFSPMALIYRSIARRFFAAEPVRWHMPLAVSTMIDIAVG